MLIIVTGSNKGIGHGIVNSLVENATKPTTILMTSRNEVLEREAYDALLKKTNKEYVQLHYHQLDIVDQSSINRFAMHVQEIYGDNSIDVLVNNAAYLDKPTDRLPISAEPTLQVNYFGTIKLTESLLPLMNTHSRVIFISSDMGALSHHAPNVQEMFSSDTLTIEQLNKLESDFISSPEDAHKLGYSNSSYTVSKVGITTYAKLLARDHANDPRHIAFVSCHPGWVKTSMGGSDASLTIGEGIETPIYLINLNYSDLIPDNGKFFTLKKVSPY
ncbi:Carbonyl reductase [NADPH] 1 [Smittium mucronatum]|uniref:Carbonyl reductase [NADPH] 1 n=1 Tax=Smittium mucronatum TaxID=133383 RepID=A0A1R0GLQ0_9FUNG|nr:Carbonyl reductase [NADPH] 1 [Smittium mucronatum]